MRKHVLLLIIILFSQLFLNAQDRNNDDGVVKLDPRMNQFQSMPNELIVKFKDGYEAKMEKTVKQLSTGLNSVDAVFAGFEIEVVDQLLPNDNPKRTLRSSKSFSGSEIKETNLNQLYRLKVSTSSEKDNYQLIEELKTLPEIEFVEPNFIVTALGEPTEEPLFSEQWGIPAVNLPTLWSQPKLPNGERKIIAIIDTGVDIEHPDLVENIWTNQTEDGGAGGYDDDENGFIDDLHGWDFVNNTPNIRDNNSHGTHCAGIAAAVGNNGIGITGAAPDALIMPLTALQSNGTGDIATIIKAINYASQNGADIISMSFGTYAYSIALEQALAQAYQTSILVGAAGNDGVPLQYGCAPYPPYAQMFPAALSFVFGVQATKSDNSLAAFSNYDCDGPVFSTFSDDQLYNYELKAPGQGIISTVPGGSYRLYNGTSMATPLVAGGIIALLERKEFTSQEMLWATLIQSANDNVVDFNAAYNYTLQPELVITAIELNDENTGDGDMRPDAGELIEIFPSIKNVGGAVNNIYYKVELSEFEDPNLVTIIDSDVEFGYSLDPYAKMKALNSIKIQIASDVTDGRKIQMVLTAWYGENLGEVSQEFTLNVENGVELSGMLMQNDTLYPNIHYIITNNFAVPQGVTLVIKPGTTIKVKKNVNIASAGKIEAIGKPDSMIVFTKADHETIGGIITTGKNDIFEYCKIEYNELAWYANVIPSGLGTYISNCIITNSVYNSTTYLDKITLKKSNFIDNTISGNMYFAYESINDKYANYPYNNIINNTSIYNKGVMHVLLGQTYLGYLPNMNIYSNYGEGGNTKYSFYDANTTPVAITTNYPSYWGSGEENIARNGIFDFYTPGSGVFGAVDLSNMATRPYAEAHGIVWKVVVNGYDAQDEFELLPPLGVGRHKFEIYFNRPMNKEVTPMIAMGVRPPYTQSAISEDGSWNDEGDIYTVYFTLKAASATDGLNRICVADAQDDEYFEIPYENQRFNVIVQSAGSLSSGFIAMPGMGKVDLEWEAPDEYFEDILGYNMYRYAYDTETETYSDTVQINNILLTDTEYTDFDVVPGNTYNYMYKVMRTDLTENDYSRSVSAVPYTAEKGDANGSLTIDVADIVTTVNYIIGGNPQPFIYEAADVNSDTYINVLDIVGIANLILNPGGGKAYSIESTASYFIENGILYVESSENIGGVQFLINAERNTADIRPLESINIFEKASQWLDENTYLLLAYSMNGRELEAGKNAILYVGDAEISNIIISDVNGGNVKVENNPLGIEEVYSNGNQIKLKLYPNPFTSSVKVAFNLEGFDNQKVDIIFFDMNGKIVEQASSIVPGGAYEIEWKPKGKLIRGMYFCQLRVNNQIVDTAKVIYQE